jgi:glycyl-tRNA synthetase beta chain
MADHADLLFELGTEELPPTALRRLSDALTAEFTSGLEKANLGHGTVRPFATPRRLGLLVERCALQQPDQEIERRGPALQAAFDTEGKPTRAAEGFARSCGVQVHDLARLKSDKGEWLMYHLQQQGQPASALLPEIAESALNRLPIPKRMRWGDREALFVRPVHWLLFLHGEQVVPCTLLGAEAGRSTRGHRFHHPDPIIVESPAKYEDLLLNKGRVIAHFDTRQVKIEQQVKSSAEALGGRAEIDPALLDEVTALVEWPVPISAGFEERFLEVPHEALILTMKKNQKYFHLLDPEGRLVNHFITIANIDSPRPEVIKEGNERVVRPRLSDAMFFWEQDGKHRLESYVDALKSVVFQQKLGSMYEKSERVARLAGYIARAIGGDPELARRAGMLSRCDLMTAMVQEFPDMQGVMGRHQAERDSEPAELAQAMEEFYMPRFSGDRLPESRTGIATSLAEKIDTLVGIFGIGQKPTGDKDPFALRRTALGALRILWEHQLPLELGPLLQRAAEALADRLNPEWEVGEVRIFLMERLRGLYQERGVGANLFRAVAEVEPPSIIDFDRRIEAVAAFHTLPEAEALAAANKRIRNILRKAGVGIPEKVEPGLFQEDEERDLYQTLQALEQAIEPLLEVSDYASTLQALAELKDPIDAFFDRVLVMADDPLVQGNRLALLNGLYQLFRKVADVSHLQ